MYRVLGGCCLFGAIESGEGAIRINEQKLIASVVAICSFVALSWRVYSIKSTVQQPSSIFRCHHVPCASDETTTRYVRAYDSKKSNFEELRYHRGRTSARKSTTKGPLYMTLYKHHLHHGIIISLFSSQSILSG
jgi:hypothetical protein